MVEGVEQFKYMGWPLDQTDSYWRDICQNNNRLRKVWGRLVKMMKREGACSIPASFYTDRVAP